MVAGSESQLEKSEQWSSVAVHESVSSVSILLYVALHAERGERLLQTRCGAAQLLVSSTKTGDYRASSLKHGFRVVGKRPVIDAGNGKLVSRGKHQCKTSAHAEANHPGLARAIGVSG